MKWGRRKPVLIEQRQALEWWEVGEGRQGRTIQLTTNS